MKIVLCAINAKYIHSNLAIRSLKAYAERNISGDIPEIEIAEYTINQQQDEILKGLYERHADVLCFSCYIWNLSYVESTAREIHKVCPKTDIWLGGPEVSYDATDVLARLDAVGGVMMGEGEKTFTKLCEYYMQREWDAQKGMNAQMGDDMRGQIRGIAYRRADGQIQENPWQEPLGLCEIPFIYSDMKEFEHKIIYYETSRGCPFSCSYCLSSIDKKLRFRSLDLVLPELQFFLDHDVPQVKFVDRTFNCKHDHAMAIWQYIMDHDNGITNFHFEVSADLLNEEELTLISQMRPGLIQLEIGVQSTNERTIREIRRTMDFEKLSEIVRRIERGKNVHQHLDLIAGLPYEDLTSFARSFDDVYALKPHQLQLGFLKVLKGSYMEEKKDDYGLVYKSTPPYEVLYTKWLSYEDVLKLKGIEEMVEVYYNSRQYERTLGALEEMYPSPYHFYEELWEYYMEHDLGAIQHKRSARYEILLDFLTQRMQAKDVDGGNALDTPNDNGATMMEHKEKLARYRELLIFDYYLRENAKTRPAFAGENPIQKEYVRNFYEEEAQEHRYLEGYDDYDRNQLRKMTHLEYFPTLGQTVLFDYQHRSPINQEAKTSVIPQ